MKIGIIIGRIGDVDGAALETEKWIRILKEMGHDIYILSGRFKKSIIGKDRETLLPGLSFFSPECEWEQNRSFFFPPDEPSELLEQFCEWTGDYKTETRISFGRKMRALGHDKKSVRISDDNIRKYYVLK